MISIELNQFVDDDNRRVLARNEERVERHRRRSRSA
jgi:hypothetical protein